MSPSSHMSAAQASRLQDSYSLTRQQTVSLIDGLSDADCTVQSMADASPAKWHLAHTTWFFETFILREFSKDYRLFNEDFPYLFNSYYEAAGPRHPRPFRGMLTRPRLEEVLAYREHVDQALLQLLEKPITPIAELVVLGINHEEQHQELLLTDILNLFAQNPMKPCFRPGQPLEVSTKPAHQPDWVSFEGGIVPIGHDGEDFAFDCEAPAHEVLLRPYRLASRTVTNGEWQAFIEDGGYRDPRHWLSDGWARIQTKGWEAPLYWEKREDCWWSMTLRGFQPVDPEAPVTHISYYEADAFAHWAGKRLPTEFEWEHAANSDLTIKEGPSAGSLQQDGRFRPAPATGPKGQLLQMFGDVWQWTASAYLPYPGFKAAEGAVGEYNGKFMSGQFVLKGASCATARGHSRPSYRNFFYPFQRWQFTGLRLAEDA